MRDCAIGRAASLDYVAERRLRSGAPLDLTTLVDRSLVALERGRAFRLRRFRSIAARGVIVALLPFPHLPLPVFVPGFTSACRWLLIPRPWSGVFAHDHASCGILGADPWSMRWGLVVITLRPCGPCHSVSDGQHVREGPRFAVRGILLGPPCPSTRPVARISRPESPPVWPSPRSRPPFSPVRRRATPRRHRNRPSRSPRS
jgi:hypothetical protein